MKKTQANAKYFAACHELLMRFKTNNESNFTFATAATFCRLHVQRHAPKAKHTHVRHFFFLYAFLSQSAIENAK